MIRTLARPTRNQVLFAALVIKRVDDALHPVLWADEEDTHAETVIWAGLRLAVTTAL